MSVLILGYLFIDRRMLHSLKSILGGIQRLSRGETVRVNEKGVFSDVASCLNQTSDLLHKQTAYRENWIAGVSHDVRTPLSVILGRAGQLEDGDYSWKRLVNRLFISRIKHLNYGNSSTT
ncbi:MAG: histidine kinase dimerization/phospho-acceptor domain-containing protein [Butyricimonas faecihominis]